jgi:hypothetical protein
LKVEGTVSTKDGGYESTITVGDTRAVLLDERLFALEHRCLGEDPGATQEKVEAEGSVQKKSAEARHQKVRDVGSANRCTRRAE